MVLKVRYLRTVFPQKVMSGVRQNANSVESKKRKGKTQPVDENVLSCSNGRVFLLDLNFTDVAGVHDHFGNIGLVSASDLS